MPLKACLAAIGRPHFRAAMNDVPPPRASSRPIPRLIQERRWWLLPLLLWGLLVVLSLQMQMVRIGEQSVEVALEGARNMFRMVMLTRNWNASHGGVYVPVTPQTPPNRYLDHPRRDVMTTDGVALTMVNPAYMTRLIGNMSVEDGGVRFHLTSLRPVQPANRADAWEVKALQAFEQGAREATSIEAGADGPQLRYMAPLVVQESCLACHEKQGYKVGDIRGGLSVSQRYAPIEAASADAIRQSALAHAKAFLVEIGRAHV